METPVRIILVGYMGSGKTTVGKALAKDLGLPFYDLDWYIESRMRKTVKQLFDERGEDGFRKVERNMRRGRLPQSRAQHAPRSG